MDHGTTSLTRLHEERAATIQPRFKPYPAYKDSGVEWLGEIPAHWEARRLKYLASVNDEALPETTDPNFEMLYVDITSVDDIRGVIRKEPLIFSKAPSRARRLVRDGDIIVSTVRTYLRAIAPIVEPEPNLVVSTGFAVVRPRQYLTQDFAAYALRAPYFVDRVVAHSVGVSYPAINASQMATFPVAAPPLPEQGAIADFLYRETAKVDALVSKKERLIQLLQEKRTALITRAVTKGVEAEVAMKDSGVEWLGEIPARWEVKRIKWVAKMESGHTPDKKVDAYWENGNIPWVSLSDTGYLKDHDYISETAFYTTALGLQHSSARLLPERSVVFSRDATIGRCAITTQPMAVSQHFIAWVCGEEVIPEYLLRVIELMEKELERFTMGATLRTIGMPDVKALVMPVPPANEQQRIVAYVMSRQSKLDTLIARIRDGIARLKEFRTALISAVVTGKIDVREELL